MFHRVAYLSESLISCR